jgi:hypothetical protein
MADGEIIDPAMAGAPDHAADYADAFRRGRELTARPPETDGGHGLGPHAIGLGVHVARMDEAGRLAVAKRAEALTQVLRGLLGATPDPAERLRMARHLAWVTPGLGLRAEHIGPRDVTNAGLAGHLSSVAGLRQALAAAAQPHYVAPLHDPNVNSNSSKGGVRYVGPAN